MIDFGALPPEINSAKMYAGPGAGPLLSAAVAWDGLAAEMLSAASAYQSVVAALTSGPWLGSAAVAAATAAAPYAAWMYATAGQAEQAAAQAMAAVAAYETAYAMTVPPPVIAANRALLAALVATNFFGQNSPAIAATEALYSEMWAQDAAAMYGYAGSSADASTLTPFTAAPQVTDPAGQAAQASAVSEAAASFATQQPSLANVVSSIPTMLQSLAAPVSTGATGSAVSPFDTLLNSSNSLSSILSSDLSAASTPLYGLSSVLGMAQTMQGLLTASVEGVADAAGQAAVDVAAAGGALGAGAVGAGAIGSMGQAATLGSLSVPASWASVIPSAQLTSAGAALQSSGLGGAAAMPPSLLGGLPRAASAAGPRAAGPRYGWVPTVMTQPPSAGYGSPVR